ncbi:hypothetical protein [Kitasatospora sp. NPDC056731]|uniref:hypothetical protein n=1 Tax=Kitasatospora sp. NPDC056731 TaxID=3155422 RepID=UPI00342B3461
MNTEPASGTPETLRAAMVRTLREDGTIRTERVAEVMARVPREHFAPEAQPADAYDPERPVVTKRDRDGLAISSVSAANVQTFMLEQADPRPGENVLEIGSGGMFAAYLAELVAPDGAVTTMDIDPEVTARTRFELGAHGHGPAATAAAARLVNEIRTWDREHRGGPGARFEVHPAGTPDGRLPAGRVVDKTHTRITISWPEKA